jgi:hypothetical protein
MPREEKTLIAIVVAFVIVLALIYINGKAFKKIVLACEKQQGTYLRTARGYECMKVEKLNAVA